MWVRNLGLTKPVPLPGTNGAAYPFWSPDSKSIGFYANGWLKRISAEGGPVQSLCRASINGSFASWGSAGTIIFYTGTGLARVAEGGGESTSIPRWGYGPSFLGDGNRFVFGKPQDDKFPAFTATLGRPDMQTQIQGMPDSLGAIQWAGADWFMFHRYTERTLVAQRVDLKTNEVVGPSTLIAERIPIPNGWASFSVSPAGLVAFVEWPPE